MPGEATLLLVGFLAYAGALRIIPALLVMTGAAVIGDTLAFRAGRRYGPRLRAAGFGARVGPERLRRADALLNRLGGRGVFAARRIAFARTLVPRLAGAAGMPYRRFARWNVCGVTTWVGGSLLLGYLAGESYETVSRRLGRATGAVLVLLFAAGLAIAWPLEAVVRHSGLAVVDGLIGHGFAQRRTPGVVDAAVFLPSQNAVVTASLCRLAWLLSWGARWPVAVAVWTAAAAGVVATGGARLYLGWSTASGTATSVLLGAAVFMVAWATRDRAVGGAPSTPVAAGAPAGQDGDEARDGGRSPAAP